MASFGDVVRKAREDRELSQAELAARVGLSQASVSHIERGRTHLSVKRLESLAGELGVVFYVSEGGWKAYRRRETM